MNLLDAEIVKIVSNDLVNYFDIVKRKITYIYECEGNETEWYQLFDINENWEKYIYVGKKIVV